MNKYSNELINNFPEYLFNEINQKKITARHSGKDIIDLGYGNPDLPTHDKVVHKLIETAKLKKNHKYSVSSALGSRGRVSCRRRRSREILLSVHVPVSQRQAAYGARAQLHHRRCNQPVSPYVWA